MSVLSYISYVYLTHIQCLCVCLFAVYHCIHRTQCIVSWIRMYWNVCSWNLHTLTHTHMHTCTQAHTHTHLECACRCISVYTNGIPTEKNCVYTIFSIHQCLQLECGMTLQYIVVECLCVYLYVCVCVYVCVNVRVYVCACTCACVRVRVCVCVCVRVLYTCA